MKFPGLSYYKWLGFHIQTKFFEDNFQDGFAVFHYFFEPLHSFFPPGFVLRLIPPGRGRCFFPPPSGGTPGPGWVDVSRTPLKGSLLPPLIRIASVGSCSPQPLLDAVAAAVVQRDHAGVDVRVAGSTLNPIPFFAAPGLIVAKPPHPEPFTIRGSSTQ